MVGALKLLEMVQQCNGYASMYSVSPGLIFSTEDSTVFFKGKSEKLDTWHLLQNNGMNASVTNQLVCGNEEGGTDRKNGLRVRLAFTMNATGMMAATFITVTSLNEPDLPKSSNPDGVAHIAIPGLCIGAVQDLRHEVAGCLALYRKERCPITNRTSEVLILELVYGTYCIILCIILCTHK